MNSHPNDSFEFPSSSSSTNANGNRFNTRNSNNNNNGPSTSGRNVDNQIQYSMPSSTTDENGQQPTQLFNVSSSVFNPVHRPLLFGFLPQTSPSTVTSSVDKWPDNWRVLLSFRSNLPAKRIRKLLQNAGKLRQNSGNEPEISSSTDFITTSDSDSDNNGDDNEPVVEMNSGSSLVSSSTSSISSSCSSSNFSSTSSSLSSADSVLSISSSSSVTVPVSNTGLKPLPPFNSRNYQEARYKTELCLHYREKNSCPHSDRCLFAHGLAELRPYRGRHPKHKTQRCKSFHENGFCNYGYRCSYIHLESPNTIRYIKSLNEIAQRNKRFRKDRDGDSSDNKTE